jgi:pyruvate/2-oxoglutarate dehydrogenase complex dihydrolipoamide acyltransferase (E2) component
MMPSATTTLRALSLCALLAVAACSKAPSSRPVAATPPAVAVSAGDVDAVQTLLMHGDRKGAEKALKPLLKRDPMSSRLLLLRDSIERDPQELLGPTSYAYAVRPGDSFEDLAERLLGNRLKAYQLARYNGIENPSLLAAGRTIRIPGSPPAPKPAPAVERPARPVAVPAPARPKPVAAPAKPSVNPAAAQRARAAGLAALNRGAVGEALAQLRRAKALDPANPVITRDLQRAERIAATVRARK